MLEILSHLFAAVCGQNPGHTWAPGGIALPCCQRCTGLYVGAAMAALLHRWLRPRLSGRFLEIHGAFLLAMVAFGFHWVTQGPGLRTVAGVLFGFGVVTFLWLPLRRGGGDQAFSRWKAGGRDAVSEGGRPFLLWPQSAAWRYFFILGMISILLPLASSQGGVSFAYVLSGLITCGALTLVWFVITDVGLGLRGAVRLVRRFATPTC